MIPVYNRKDFIADCIQSAIDQTITDIEVVVVDNASDDGTWEICQEYANRDSRVKIFRNGTNIGPVLNWKQCIDEAKGEFGKILFSDDLIFPEYLEKTLPLIMNDDVALVFTSVKIGSEIDNYQTAYEWQNQSGHYPIINFINSILWASNVPASPGAALFRMVDLKRNLKLEIPSPVPRNFLKHGAGPDVLLYLLTVITYQKIGFVSEPLCFFRAHKGSITIQNVDNQIRDSYNQAIVWFAENHLDSTLVSKVVIKYWLQEIKANRKWFSHSFIAKRYSYNFRKIDFISFICVLRVWVFRKFFSTGVGMAKTWIENQPIRFISFY